MNCELPSVNYKLLVGGKLIESVDSFEVINPATGAVFAKCPSCSVDLMEQSIEAADSLPQGWKSNVECRREALKKCADLIEENSEAIAQLLTQEQGKPISFAAEEVGLAALWFRHMSDEPFENEILVDNEEKTIELHKKPHGIVAAITPWNFPLLLASWKLVPAILAGNSVILKPSPYTPLSSLKLGEVISEALPAGVLSVLAGGDELGNTLVHHPKVRKIAFTGSVPTGKHILQSTAPDLKRITLELGGNDAAIVLKDVKPKEIAENLFWGAFLNSGQVCFAIKRLYVQDEVFDQVVQELKILAENMPIGDGMDATNVLGPLANKAQLEKVQVLVEDAKERGATVVTGGHTLFNEGYFFAPTIITDVHEGVPLVDEEQFGPVLPVIKFSDVKDAVRQANATNFGLGASVWTNDMEKARAIIADLECGNAWVNKHIDVLPNVPVGGSKWSGIGYENGQWGLSAYYELQTVNIPKK